MAESLKLRIDTLIDQRRTTRRNELKLRREEIFSRFPRIAQIEKQLDETGVLMMRKVLDGSCSPEEAVRSIMEDNAKVHDEKKQILLAAGYPADYIEDIPRCAKCGDTGYSDGKICSCVRAELNREFAAEANLSDKLSAQTFDSFRFDLYSTLPNPDLGVSPRENIDAVYRQCRRFAENFGPDSENLFFSGGCGLGKTFLSSAIANYLLANGTDVLYISANSLFPILEDLHFNRNVSDTNRYLVERTSDCDLLILDDLGAEFSTPFTTAELFRIINNRVNSYRKMIISTNLSLSELKSVYSERIYSRIAGGFEIVAFFGDDIRRKLKMEVEDR